MAGPLDGIRVIELGGIITGPLAASILADLGADVIKVEHPDGGDMFRSFRGGSYSYAFCAVNRRKRSVTVDLKSDDGREILRSLISNADILLENFRPGVLERLGIEPKALRAINPSLIHCSITGFGHKGPYKDRPSYDTVAQGLSGMASTFLDPEQPKVTGPTISDSATAITAAYGILGAVVERERTGVARRVDVNMLEATLALAPDIYTFFKETGVNYDATSRASASQSYALPCSDDRIIVVHLSSHPRFWEPFIEAMECQELATDPRFEDRMDRVRNYSELAASLQVASRKNTSEHWMARLEQREVPFAPVYKAEEVFEDPQIQHLGSFYDIEHPEMGNVTNVRRPVWYDGSRDDQELAPAPTLGEHTEEVLRELGVDDKKLADLRASKVV